MARSARGRIVVATGATSGRSCSPTTTGPGVMLAGAARDVRERYGVRAGRAGRDLHEQRTTDAVAATLARCRVEIVEVVDAGAGDRRRHRRR